MGDKLYWEALQLKLHYDMDNIGLSMIVFTQIIVIGCHNNVHISTGLIACQLFRATLGTSLDLEIMIHDGIWINFPTGPCVSDDCTSDCYCKRIVHNNFIDSDL
jgi:hypothetical protein